LAKAREGQKTRRREAASVAQVTSGGGLGNPRYRGSRSLAGRCPAHLTQPTAAQAGIRLSHAKGRQPVSRLASTRGYRTRNEAVLAMRKEGLAHWKKISGYHRRLLADLGNNAY